jgi:hypothetical protein
MDVAIGAMPVLLQRMSPCWHYMSTKYVPAVLRHGNQLHTSFKAFFVDFFQRIKLMSHVL